MAYVGNQPVPQATQTRDRFVATSGQTSFATSGYTPNFVDVYLDGVKLDTSEFTATNGSDVVLASGATTGQILEVIAVQAFNSSEKLPDQTGNNGKYLSTDGSALSWEEVTDPTPAAVSDQANTSTGFFALPKGTTAERPASPSDGYVRFNTDEGYIEEYRQSNWQPLSNIFSATGGSVTTYTSGGQDYKVHTFTSTGTFTVESGTATADVLVVAGGGGAGSCPASNSNGGGGGGAGGFLFFKNVSLNAGSYSCTVGAGGAASSGAHLAAASGANSQFGSFTAAVGGGGVFAGSSGADGKSGGSGGAAANNVGTGGSGTSGQGNRGGDANAGGASPNYGNPGGGGAKEAGGGWLDGTSRQATTTKGGDGGDGYTEGDSVPNANGGGNVTFPAAFQNGSTNSSYAGGGGGQTYDGGTLGQGGIGGGGNGSSNGNNAQSGTANTGGGGGSAGGAPSVTSGSGGAGGSGIIIIRYAI
jgi:hypothetical protein